MQHSSASALEQRTRFVSWWPVAALLLAAGLTWWLRAPLHQMPLERDEGAYAVIAERWLAGDTLYRELFDHKPPLVYAVFALAALIPGDPVVAIRALATLYLLVTAGVLLALGQRLYGPLAAVAAVLAMLAYGSSWRFQGLTFNTEAVMALPVTVACLLVVQALQEDRAWLLFWAGCWVGLAALAKPVALLLLGPLLLAPVLARWPLKRAGTGAATGLAGVMLLPGLCVLWLALEGASGAAYEALIDYNRLYAAESLAQGWTLAKLWPIWAPMLTLGLPALLGFGVAPLVRPAARAGAAARWWPAHLTVGLWGLALLATAVLSLRPYPHYYLAAVPLLSLLAGAGIGALARLLAAATRRSWLAPGAMLLASIALIAPVVVELTPLRRLAPAAQISALYAWDGVHFFAPASEVAAFVREHVPPEEPIFIWAAEPQIYTLAARRPVARFVYDYPVDRLPGARDELLATLRRTPPPLIVTYSAVRPIGVHPFFEEYGYTLRATIGGYDIFERSPTMGS